MPQIVEVDGEEVRVSKTEDGFEAEPAKSAIEAFFDALEERYGPTERGGLYGSIYFGTGGEEIISGRGSWDTDVQDLAEEHGVVIKDCWPATESDDTDLAMYMYVEEA